MRILLGSVVIASVLASSASAKCPTLSLEPLLITPGDAVIPRDGGILVGWQFLGRGSGHFSDPSKQPSWKLLIGTKPVATTLETLAPGLTVYRTTAPATGALWLADVKGKELVRGRRPAGRDDKADAPALPAPRPTEARRVMIDSQRAFVVTLTVPDEAAALITYRRGVAIVFGLVTRRGATTMIVFEDPQTCSMPPPGTLLPDPGDSLTFAWVDDFGRVSKPSPAIKVMIETR